jgi:hypothetical protein
MEVRVFFAASHCNVMNWLTEHGKLYYTKAPEYTARYINTGRYLNIREAEEQPKEKGVPTRRSFLLAFRLL